MSALASSADGDIRDALTLLCEYGQAYEMRVMGTRYGTVAGLFRIPDHLPKMVESLAEYNKEKSVYVTINPVNTEAHDAPLNVVRHHVPSGSCVADTHVAKRTWLPIDFDVSAAHDAKLSATDEEVERATKRAVQVAGWLTKEMRFPVASIVLATSGNGAHLLISIDLPNDDESKVLLQRCLQALYTRFPDDGVKIDTATYNAGRIWKVYGTVARRGANTPEHPHRLAKILKVPAVRKQVSTAVLHALAALAPEPEVRKREPYTGPPRTFDAETFVRRHFPTASGPRPYEGGRKWFLNECPFDASHTGSSVSLIQFPSGAVSFACLHASCRDKQWRDVRDMLEPRPVPPPLAPTTVSPPPVPSAAPSAVAEGTPPRSKGNLTLVQPDEEEPPAPPTEGETEDMYRRNYRAVIEFSDQGNADRLLSEIGDTVLYCEEFGCWLIWDGKRWVKDPGAHTMARFATRMVEGITREQRSPDISPERSDALRKWAAKCGDVIRIKNMIEAAKKMRQAKADDFDGLGTDYLLNCENGTVDLRTGKLRPHRKEDRITKIVPVAYDEHAECPLWDHSIKEWMDGNAEMALYLQRILGYGLCGDVSEHAFWVWNGIGSNGKSLCVEIVKRIMGDYAAPAPQSVFAEKKHPDGPTNDIATLKGMRWIYSEEVGSMKLNENLVKQIVSGNGTQVRFLNKEFFVMKFACKIVMLTNDQPRITGTDNGIWRRVKMVPWDVRYPDNEIDKQEAIRLGKTWHTPDKKLDKKLEKELPGILRWMVEGFSMYLQRLNSSDDAVSTNALGHPATVVKATSEYRGDQDFTAAWIDEYCYLEKDAWTPTSDLYKSYLAWMSDQGTSVKPMTKIALGRDLKKRGYRDAQQGIKRTRGFHGIGLRDDEGAPIRRPGQVTLMPSEPSEEQTF